MKTIKRIANAGERIKIIQSISPTGLYVNGDIFTVRSSGNVGVQVEGILPTIYHMEYEVIEEERVEIPHTTYVELAKSIDNNVHDALQKAYEEGYRKGKTDTEFERAFQEIAKVTSQFEETPQAQRDRIVEQAKADVKELSKEAQAYRLLRPKFVINREKRTIVCLLERFDLGYIAKRGIAKCAPDDCFNVHIGKAIALRRALGLEMPAEYLDVPNPTEVRVGDIIRNEYTDYNGKGLGEYYTKVVVEISEDKVRYNTGTFDYIDVFERCEIIDDSRGEVSE